MKILFFLQAPLIASSGRYRVWEYLDNLKQHGIEGDLNFPMSDDEYTHDGKNRSFLEKLNYYVTILVNRLKGVLWAWKYDVIFIQRGLLLPGPMILESLLRMLNTKIIYDFDDALYTEPSQFKDRKNLLYRFLFPADKIEKLIKISSHVIVASEPLVEYAIQYSKNVTVLSDPINTDRYKVKNYSNSNDKVIIGWIGTPYTAIYLNEIKNALIILSKKHNYKLKIVGAHNIKFKNVEVQTKDWKFVEEMDDLRSFDIGIMPLSDDEWAKGKTGTKLLQYMGAGLPVVCSPVGVNTKLVKEGENGFLAVTEDEWVEKLERLVLDPALRKQMGNAGRKMVKNEYSVKSNLPKLISILQKVAKG